MTSNDKNPLTPLNTVRPSDTEMEEMFLNIIQRVENEPDSAPARKTNANRVRKFPSIMAGVAAVVLVVGGLFAISHHWFNQATTAQKHHVVHPHVNPMPANQIGPPSSVKDQGVALDQVKQLHMNNAEDGWAMQPKNGEAFQLLHTTDGGTTWQDVTPTQVLENNGFSMNKLSAQITQYGLTWASPGSNQMVFAVPIPRSQSGTGMIARNMLIVSTHDGGKTWTTTTINENIQNDNLGQRPMTLDFINSKDGWLATSLVSGGGETILRGGLYHTRDGGAHWKLVSVASSKPNGLPYVNEDPTEGWVDFLNPNVGFTLGETPTQTDLLDRTKPSVYRTTDGGVHWTKLALSFPQPYHVANNQVLPPRAFGSTVILPVLTQTANPSSYTLRVYVSHDAGLHFAEQGKASLKANESEAIQYGFWDATHGWFFFGGRLYTTSDQGNIISQVPSDQTFKFTNTISWLNQKTAIVAGYSGAWKTTDGGKHWVTNVNKTTSEIVPNPKNIQMVSQIDGWAVVNGNQIAITNNGKSSWSLVTPQGLQQDTDAKMAALSGQSAVVVANVVKGSTYQSFDVFVTNDGGKHWTKKSTNPSTGWAYVMDIDFVNRNTGWLVVQTKHTPNQSEVVTLYQTNDGGETWHPISKSGTNGLPRMEQVSTIRFVTPKIGWTATLGFSYVTSRIGKAWIYETTDGGVTWHQIDLPIPSSLKKDYINANVPVFTSRTNGTCTITYTNNPEMGTNKTMVFQTTDGGKHWTALGK